MVWFIITITSYFFSAVANLVDKFLLKKLIPEPAVYAFSISLVGAIGLLFAPFDLRVPTFLVFTVSMFSGVSFTTALYYFFKSLKNEDASKVVPVVGSLTPIYALFLSFVFLGEILHPKELLAFVLILTGGFYVLKDKEQKLKELGSTLRIMSLSALLFATSHVLAKYIYTVHSFEGGIALKGLGSLLGAMVLYTFSQNREVINKSFQSTGKTLSGVFLFGQVSAGLGFLLQNYAFSIGSVALTSAFAGVQYVLLILLTLVISKVKKGLVYEKMNRALFFRKLLSTSLIIIGTLILFI